MKKALILINAYSKLKSALYQSERLKEEFYKLGVDVDVKRNDFFAGYIAEDGNVRGTLDAYDFCVYLDKDKYVSEMLEKTGLRLFNAHRAIEVCDDKMLTLIALSGSGIPVPTTLPGLLCYDKAAPVSAEALDRVENMLGYPVIVKACHGSLGKQVFKADDRGALERVVEKLKLEQYVFEKFITESFGKDIRAIVIGGKVFAAMIRRSNGDFRSNLNAGGSGEPIEIDEKVKDMCEKAARVLGLDYCGIDVLFGRDGYVLCEVNSNAFFGGIEAVTGKNVAAALAGHIFKKVYGDV
ncbi:MAG: RimK family alpha-L-glutamate ligase [Clostridia bacterium]|nr:RimK family alpha-L-glutamate ligase [Clostridia bacterium]